jgi:predicted transcriptional regulator
MTWKHLAKKSNSLPSGWSTADEIAADLDCEPSEVPKILAASIRDGLVEKQNFPHWQPGSRQLLYQTGYRQKTGKVMPQVSDKTPDSIPGIPADLLPKVRDKILAHPHKTASAIKDLFSTNNRMRLSVAAIRSLLDKPPQNRK